MAALAPVPEDTEAPPPDTAEPQPDTPSEFQVEMRGGDGDTQVFTVSGTWHGKSGGRLEAELHGLVTVADGDEELSVTGCAAVQVQRILGVPVQVRRIALDLDFGDRHLWVRHNPSFGIQLLGLDIPGMLIVTGADGSHWEEVTVRINPSHIVTVAKDIAFARPDPTDPP